MANVTSSGNTTIKPTINTAKFMGSSYAAGSSLESKFANIYSSLSTLAIKIKKNFDNINLLTETIQNASLHSHTDNDDSDGDNKDNISNDDNSKLDEINSILLDIGSAISLDFANRIAENKEDINDTRKEKSKGKFERAESVIEKQKQRKVGNIFTKTASKASSPISGIFGKLLALGGILGTGIVTNAAFDWLKNKENQEKLSTFFKIVQKNWKWMVGTAAFLIGTGLLIQLIGALTTLTGVFAILTKPAFLAALAIFGGSMAIDKYRKMDFELNPKVLDEKVEKKEKELSRKLTKEEIEDIKKGKNIDLKLGGNRDLIAGSGLLGSPGGSPMGISAELYFGSMLAEWTMKLWKKIFKGKPKDLSYLNNSNSQFSNVNFIPVNLDTIENRELMLSSSSVATEVTHISAKNLSDPYIQLSPDYYGIHV